MTDLERIKKDVVEMDSRANVCWYDTKVLTKAVRLILEELTADRKTENSSEKPNNCEECEHWNDAEDGCDDRYAVRTDSGEVVAYACPLGCEQTDCPWK